MNLYLYLTLKLRNGGSWNPIFGKSTNYKNWKAILDFATCIGCRTLNGKIWEINAVPEIQPLLHDNCRCVIIPMETVKAGTATIKQLLGADYILKTTGFLPDYYISLEEAVQKGWKPGKWPSNFIQDKTLSAGVYENRDNHLPNAEGRIWYEADINYTEGKRNSQRIIWSNDGLIFVTFDHYQTFMEVI